MAAPSSTVPGAAAAAGCSSPSDGVLQYIEEVAVGAATLLQQAPVVGEVCAAFLGFQQLVDTARSNREALCTLGELCDVVIKGGLHKLSERSGPFEGFVGLKKHVGRAGEIAKLCNGVGVKGAVKRFVLARRISNDIAAIRSDVLAFCSVNNLAISVASFKERRIADLAIRVKIPSGAPRIRDWYVEREAVIGQACDRLGVGSNGSGFREPRAVGLAGPSGAGKSTVASMVVAREDMRACFHRGVVWLQVGQGAKYRLPELMIRLADMVYETVMRKACRPPRKAGIDTDPKDGGAYIREVVDESSRRFLVVADDVWEVEVLEALRNAGVWVLYTTRDDGLLPEAPPLCLDQILKEEAELVLRRAADLDDDAPLPEAAYELMTQCEYGVLYLAFVGRWSDVRGRGRHGGEAWRAVLSRIVEAQQGGEGVQLLSWRAAVLRAGLAEIATENIKNKELYLSLALMPKGLAFPSEVAAVLLYGHDFSTGDLEAAIGVVATLERWSILTLEDGGLYRVHDEHADFVQGPLGANLDIRDRALPRWREYISSVRALLTISGDWLAQIWELLGRVGGESVPLRPYDEALHAMDPLSADRPAALSTAAYFSYLRKDWMDAYHKNVQLAKIQETNLGVDHPDVATTLDKLGVCALATGRTEEAEGFCGQALTIREEKLGVDHPHVAWTLDKLGVCALATGRTEEAERFHRRALTIREEKQGVDHLDVAFTLHKLGVCAYEAGRTEEAERFHRRALTIREEKLGVDHLDVAYTLDSLGVCALKAGRTEEAERFHRRALAIQEEKLGVDDLDVTTILDHLGRCALRAGRTEEAERFHRRALTIQEKKLGVDHLDVAITLHNLGRCATHTGRTEEAERFHRRALTIQEEKQGVDHQEVVTTRRASRNLGINLSETE
eukprot:g7240.t1